MSVEVEVSTILRKLSIRGYVVGGVVRDLILKRSPKNDIDIVVEYDALKLAEALHALGTVRVHEAFHTLKITTHCGGNIDIISARRESYPTPGALPKVELATIQDDLRRRDFTINAIAIELQDYLAGAVKIPDGMIDVVGGYADLTSAVVIRVLHEASFIDDPTRVFRAHRYRRRFAGIFDSRTKELLDSAVNKGAVNTLTTFRIFSEIKKAILEDQPNMQLLEIADLLGHVDPWRGANFDFLHLPISTREELWRQLYRAATPALRNEAFFKAGFSKKDLKLFNLGLVQK